MIWPSLFLISISQGLFLVALILYKARKSLSTAFMIPMLGIMILTNLGYFSIHTNLIYYVPQLFGVPFGMMFLFGPLFYFYSRSVVDGSFQWEGKYALHFIPYALQLLFNLPLLLADKPFWLGFINTFLAGEGLIRIQEKILFSIQDLHLAIYLFFTLRWLKKVKNDPDNVDYIISISTRIQWLRQLALCLSLFLITVISSYIFLLFRGTYNPATNYIYTLISSLFIYFIAWKLVLNPELIRFDFARKYKTYKSFNNPGGEEYIQKIKFLMQEEKRFTDTGFKLASLAEEIGLPRHQLSKLINEKFGKSFNDFVNEYRVNEFIARINEPAFSSYSIFGVAMDVGFVPNLLSTAHSKNSREKLLLNSENRYNS